MTETGFNLISIIVSSYKEEFFKQFLSSLEKTIGFPYEIVKIENHNKYSIAEAYNLGADKAKGGLLLFVHEDVTFHTENWGRVLLSYFEKNGNLGLVGVTGAIFKNHLPTGIGFYDPKYYKSKIIQSRGNERHTIDFREPKDSRFDKVQVLDGVFLAMPKSIWINNRFDESIPGFHLYDLDSSLRISQYNDVYVIYDILITHYSMGNFDKSWMIQSLKYHKRKDKKHLFSNNMTHNDSIRRYWLHMLKSADLTFWDRINYLYCLGLSRRTWKESFHFLFRVK